MAVLIQIWMTEALQGHPSSVVTLGLERGLLKTQDLATLA